MWPVATIPISSMADTVKKPDDSERNYDRDGDRDIFEDGDPRLRFASSGVTAIGRAAAIDPPPESAYYQSIKDVGCEGRRDGGMRADDRSPTPWLTVRRHFSAPLAHRR